MPETVIERRNDFAARGVTVQINDGAAAIDKAPFEDVKNLNVELEMLVADPYLDLEPGEVGEDDLGGEMEAELEAKDQTNRTSPQR